MNAAESANVLIRLRGNDDLFRGDFDGAWDMGLSWSTPPPQVIGRGALRLLVLHLSKFEEIVDHGWQQGHRGQGYAGRY